MTGSLCPNGGWKKGKSVLEGVEEPPFFVPFVVVRSWARTNLSFDLLPLYYDKGLSWLAPKYYTLRH